MICRPTRLTFSALSVNKFVQVYSVIAFRPFTTSALLTFALVLLTAPASHAQLPFYTDDPSVTPVRTVHVEFFNEIDALQSAQFPNLRQNTANIKINTGLPHNLELDFDAPYLAITRNSGTPSSTGAGDTNLGIKWNFRREMQSSHRPVLSASFYVEFPTGDSHNQLGSGLIDYWLNFILQEPITPKTRINLNLGVLFAGNTSTGVVGINTTRGQVYTSSLSVLHDINSRLTVGGEVYAGVADTDGLGRTQLQGMTGGSIALRSGLALTFGLIVGKYEASPRIGGQVGLSLDFPDMFRHPTASRIQTAFR
jgi:hypothetical protein